MPEMSKSEQAAFASMANEQATTPAEPEPATQTSEPAGEPEDAATPEPEAEAEPEGGDVEGQPKPERRQYVSHQAFHEERTRRQQLEAENRRLAEERARFDERLRIIQEMNAPPPAEKPDLATDPIGSIQSHEDRLARLEQGGQQWNAAQEQQQQLRKLAAAASYDADRFRATAPDYLDAYQYWGQTRAAELQAYGVPAHEIPARLEQEQLDIAAAAFQQGTSPAETLYRIAHYRGFRGRGSNGGSGGNGSNANGGDAASDQINRVAAGQERNRTLSGTGGGAVPVRMTGERLAKMSNADFDAWISKNPKAADRLLGKG